jgi:hypothetical protein
MGKQPKGAKPLDPLDLFFEMRVYGHAPRGEDRQTPGARGSITIQYCPLQVFSRAELSIKGVLSLLIRRGFLKSSYQIRHGNT